MGFGTTGWSLAAKPCDSCKSAVAALFCRDDSAALCFSCDAKIHSKQTRPHERVWMCEVCEQAPAAVTCKADAAALCVSCDADIHSANPLARRHERVPVEPFFEAAESVVVRSSAFNFLVLPDDSSGGGAGACPHEEAEAEAEAWLLPNPNPNPKLICGATDVAKGGDMLGFFHEIDPFLDLDYGNSMDRFHGNTADGLVPVQTKVGRSPVVNGRFELDFCRPNNQKLSSFGYLGQSLSHSISSSSLDVGVVPDGNCNSMSDISYPAVQTSSSGADPCVSSSVASQSGAATQLCGMDREARVLRYREKRKNRKFEKTIRYASRKAYAETRPRIKGRFAKRNEVEAEDSIYSSVQYGVVPTF